VIESLQRQGRPAVYCVWHNTIFYLVYILAPLGLTAMISRSGDGEDTWWVMRRFGFKAARGSASDGATGAMREMLRVLARGESVIVTPDGPRGPRYELKPGVVALARRKGLPVVPIAYSAPRRWEFESWDRMKLPKPFSRTVVWVGDPLDLAQDDDASANRRVENAMRRLTRLAEAYTGADRRFPDEALGEQKNVVPVV
jgi:lysophospholipid acyltransferase (LPLAT)-like uncharacterized protein